MAAVGILVGITLHVLLPSCIAAPSDYKPNYFFTFPNENYLFRTVAITTDDGLTSFFVPYQTNYEIQSVFATKDFFDYSQSTALVQHLTGKHVLPLFILYDAMNTANLSATYIIGLHYKGYDDIAYLLSNTSDTNVVCSYQCMNLPLWGGTVTSWDPARNRWVSLLKSRSSNGVFLTSPDLKKWTPQKWVPEVTVDDKLIEMFPIADDADASEVTWIIVKKSAPDPAGVFQVEYGTFEPDDANQNYRYVRKFDYSTDLSDFTIITDKSTGYQSRKVLVSKYSNYLKYGINATEYVTARQLSYSGGVLKQLPIGTVYGPSRYERSFPTMILSPPTLDFFSCQRPSRSFAISLTFDYSRGEFGLHVFVDPNDDTQYGVSVSYDGSNLRMERTNYLPDKATPDPSAYAKIDAPYSETGPIDLLVLVDNSIVEAFIGQGFIASSVFAYPDPHWNRYQLFTSSLIQLSDVDIKVFDELGS